MELLKSIISVIVTGAITLGSWAGVTSQVQAPVVETKKSEVMLGGFNPSGGGTYRLRSSVGISDTTIQLSSFKEPISNTPYTMSYLNSSIGYGTIDPQTSRSEFVSFTGITQNSDGTASITGVSRGLSRTPAGAGCTASTTLAQRHPGQSIFIISDSPCLFSEYAVKQNDEVITGSWTVPTPTSSGNPTPKSYVDSLVNGGAVSTDSVIVAGTAGETITSGQILYFNRYSAQWFKAKADVASTSRGVLLGVAQGSGTASSNVSGGILLKGLDSKNSGGTPGNVIYISSSTGGATTTSAGTIDRVIGVIKSASQFYFDPSFVAANIEGSTGKISDNIVSTSTILASNIFGPGTDGDLTVAANSTTTLTRDMYYSNLTVNGSIVTNNFRIFVKNTISGTGNISSIGNAGSAANLNTAGAGGATTTGFFVGCAGTNGASGRPGTTGNGANSTSTSDRLVTFTSGISGSGGDGGASGSGDSGGTAGTAGRNTGTTTSYGVGTIASVFDVLDISTTSPSGLFRISVGSSATGGAAGGYRNNAGGGNSGGGGGGGECGGIVFVAAKTFNGSFGLYGTGGAGGTGGNGTGGTDKAAGGGGGGGGKGGMGIRIYYTDSWSGSCNMNGGAGGTGGTAQGSGAGNGNNGTSGANGYCVGVNVNNLIR